MSHTVFLARNASNFERLEGLLREAGYDLVIGPKTTPGVMLQFPPDQLDALFGGVDAIVTSMREEYTREVLEAAVRARVLVSPLLGVDNIDVDGCTEFGIPVGYGAHPQNYLGVAEATAAFIVTLLKRLRAKERSLRTSGWSGGSPGTMVMGRTIGLVGFGRAGSAVAARLQGWGARFLIADPFADPALVAAAGGELAPLETVLRESDVVSLHAFLAPETRGMIGEAQLRLMKPTAYLVNLARGGLVDQPALIRALQEEWIAGAALDVFEVEPLPADSPLRAIDPTRLILTPHNAGFSQEGAEAGPLAMLENLKNGLAGEPPLYFLNPQVLPAWRARLARLGVPEPAIAAPTPASGQ
jgi:D-3-phosphoglycerate dehydrogenase